MTLRALWPVVCAAVATPSPCARAGGATADVMIVERPSALILFDTYQQRLGASAASAIPRFVPIVLLRAHDVMGDGFTPCADVEIDGAMLYCQEESSGEFATGGSPGYTEVFHGVTLRGDTVVLLSGEALRLRLPSSHEEFRVPSGTRAFRVFESQHASYVRLASPGGRFAWAVLPPGARGSSWRPEPAASREEFSAEEIVRRVSVVTEGANRTLARIYRSVGPGGRAVPSFRVSRAGREISCAISPEALAPQFSGSLLALLPPLERALGGTGLHPVIAGSAIHILLP